MSRPALINRRSNNELKQMSDLNNRFVNFIQLVKSETIRGEELQQSLIEEKEKHFADFKQSNRNYLEKLNSVKKYLNDMCVDVCEELVKEKRNRILADWYDKLARFEEGLASTTNTTNNSNYNIRESVNTSVVLNSSGYFETSSPCSNSYVNSSDFGGGGGAGGLFLGASELTLVEQGSPPHSAATATVSATIAVAAVAANGLPPPINLSNLSATMSSSQSSLNSCSSSNFSISPSSSSSSSSSSAYTSTTTTNTATTTTRQSVLSSSDASSEQHFSLEVYLSALNKQKVQLNEDYDRKVAECAQLKQNVVELNSELNGLNDNLDNVKIDNVKLQDDVKQLRREIDFLRQLYTNKNSTKRASSRMSSCSSQETSMEKNRSSNSESKLDLDVEILEYDDDELLREEETREEKLETIEIYEEEEEMRWVREEIAVARAEAAREYEEFTSEQLCAYECELEGELMGELDRLESELWPSHEHDESDAILDELLELNAQLADDYREFESLMKINAELNDRLIQLSSCLIEFNSMSKEKQERMIVNYSIVSLKKENESRRSQVKELKQELNTIKSQLIQNDAFDLIINSENQSSLNSQSSSYSIQSQPTTMTTTTLESTIASTNNSESTSSMQAMSNINYSSTSSSQLQWNGSSSVASRLNLLQQQELLLKELDEIKCAFHIRPYCAQIEYTKSNLFAYFVIKFDIIYHTYAPPQPQQAQSQILQQQPSQQTSTPSSVNSNINTPPAAKIAVTNSNSVNKNNCILNCLKIVYDSIDGHSILIENSHRILDIDLSEWTLKREIYQIEKTTTMEKLIEYGHIDQNNQDAPTTSSRRCKPDHCIEYKFPKGFRLKRRKKINLIAAGNKQSQSSSQQNTTTTTTTKWLNRPQTPSMIPRLNSKLSISCNSLNGGDKSTLQATTNATKPSKLPIRRPIKPSCSSMSLNNSNNSSNRAQSTTTTSAASSGRSKCSCCACKTMTTTRRGDVEFFEIEEVSNWGSGILVLTKLINTKNVIKMVNYRYLKHIWVNNNNNNNNGNHEKNNLSNNTVVFDTEFPDDD